MAENQTQFTTQYRVTGAVDASLPKAMGLTVAQLQQMQKHIAAFNKLASLSASSMSGLTPAITMAVAQTNRLQWAMTKAAAAGVIIGNVVTASMRIAAQSIRNAISTLSDFGTKSLEIAAKYQRMIWSFGNVVGNRGLGNLLASQIIQQSMRGAGGIKALETAKAMVGFGMSPGSAAASARQQQDIVFGAGGGAEELHNFSMGFGRILSRGYVDARTLATLEHLGIPIKTTLKEMYGAGDLNITNKKGEVTGQVPEGTSKINYMLLHHQITAAMFQKVLDSMTTGTGSFVDGMKRYSETYQGAVDTFVNESQRAMGETGSLLMTAFTPLLVWLNESGIWESIKQWLGNLNAMATGVVNFAKSLKGSELISPLMSTFQKSFDAFNKWIGSFFTSFLNPATGDLQVILNPTGEEKVREVFEYMKHLFSDFNNFINSDTVQKAIRNTGFVLSNTFNDLRWMLQLGADIAGGQWGDALKDLGGWSESTKERSRAQQAIKDQQAMDARGAKNLYTPWGSGATTPFIPWLDPTTRPFNSIESIQQNELYKHWNEYNTSLNYWSTRQQRTFEDNTYGVETNTQAQAQLTNQFGSFMNYLSMLMSGQPFSPGQGSMGGNYGLHGGLYDSPTHDSTYFEHDDEGHNSMYGPHENRLGDTYGVGLSRWNQKKHPLGSWVTIRTPNGKIVRRQVNETATRDIEFHTPSDAQGRRDYGEGKSQILENGGGASITVHNHIYAMDSHGVDRVMEEHGHRIAKHIQRVLFDESTAETVTV